MSRPQKIIPPVKGNFQDILTSVAIGSGVGKRAALKIARAKASGTEPNIIKATDKTTPKKP
jgi:hypothetical protein